MSLARIWRDLRVRAHSSYKPLAKRDDIGPTSFGSSGSRLLLKGARRFIAIGLLGLIFLLALIFRSSPNIDIPYIIKRQHSPELSAGFLHILVPTSEASVEYCRTSLSAATLGYPAIQVVGWEDRYSSDEFGEGAKEWGKLVATLKYLEGLPQERNDDLVLVVDAQDTWFQLRPEVLIRRYRDIIKQADKRLKEKLGKIADTRNIRTSVVFPAQTVCPTGSKDDITCYAAPESPLASHLKLSKSTNAETFDDSVVDSFLRYPDPGMMLGTASSLHKVHHDAYNQWSQHPKQYPSRHSIFSLLFSNQEYLRELLYQEPRKPKFKSSSFTTTHPDPQSFITTSTSPDFPDFEYGITLDYTSLLSLSSASAATWLNHDDTTTTLTPATSSLDPDIPSSRPPFWSLSPVSSPAGRLLASLPRTQAWSSTNLFTNLDTGITPVIVTNYPNAATNPDNRKQEYEVTSSFTPTPAGWRKMWFHPHLRDWLTVRAYEPFFPVSSEILDRKPGGGWAKGLQKALSVPVEKRWWGRIMTTPVNKHRVGFGFLVKGEDGAAKGQEKEGPEWVQWGEVCAPFVENEGETEKAMCEGTFGDERGGWEDPVVFPPFWDVEDEGM